MDLLDRLRELSSRIPAIVDRLSTEEATKNALVMPFISALGYDPFNPLEVVPEYTADLGLKKGEKVDYAIMSEGNPIILIECKRVGANLDKHDSQLYRYFNATPARIAVLTDGVCYRFYSDLRETNKMDDAPFLELDLHGFREEDVAELGKLSKQTFDLESVLCSAIDLKYTREIDSILAQQKSEPTDDFVRVFVDRIYDGRVTQGVLERFRALVQESWTQYIAREVDRRLKDALSRNREDSESETTEGSVAEEGEREGETDDIETTMQEMSALYIVKAIVRDVVSTNRVALRDAMSYCAILLDDNNRKPICRLWFNARKKYLGVFDAHKKETRIPVSSPEDIFEHAEKVRESLQHALT